MSLENRNTSHVELGKARIISKTLLCVMADILDCPSLKELPICLHVILGEFSKVNDDNIIELQLESEDRDVLPINTILEELSHLAHAINNPTFTDTMNSHRDLFKLEGRERNEAFKLVMREKNMLELFAKLSALHLLTRSDVIEIFSKIFGLNEMIVLLKFRQAYYSELGRCASIRRETLDAFDKMEYMEAYGLLAEFPEDFIRDLDLAAVSKLSPDELRALAYQVVGRRDARRISEWYQDLEHENIDSGMWMLSMMKRI